MPFSLSQVHDITAGMVYLHSIPMLHHWLVPGNILIGEHLTAKVSDYGFYETKVQSKYIKTLRDDDNCKKDYRKLPVFYTPPEFIEKNEYTQASDVYSFGKQVVVVYGYLGICHMASTYTTM